MEHKLIVGIADMKMAKDSGYTPEEVMEALKNAHDDGGGKNGNGPKK